VQFAKKTAGKKRYHHPAVSAADMMAPTQQTGKTESGGSHFA
jgi:hypothetical protein